MKSEATVLSELNCFVVGDHLNQYKWYDYKHTQTSNTKQIHRQEKEKKKEKEKRKEKKKKKKKKRQKKKREKKRRRYKHWENKPATPRKKKKKEKKKEKKNREKRTKINSMETTHKCCIQIFQTLPPFLECALWQNYSLHLQLLSED